MKDLHKKTELKVVDGITLERDGDNLRYNGFLDLRGTGITSLPDNLTVGGDLYLQGVNITSIPESLIVGDSLIIRDTKITSLPDNLIVGGCLVLCNNKITSLPDNLTVGGNIDIRRTGITSLPKNTILSGMLVDHRKQVKSLPDNMAAEWSSLDVELGLFIGNKKNKATTNHLEWRDGKYIKVDGIFSEVLHRRGNVRVVKRVGLDEIAYLVTDGDGRWSHGDTLKEAKNDLIYKISNTDKSKYNDYTLDTKVTFEEGIEMYRVITGACSFGVKDFVENRLKKIKGEYKVSEIISITKGEYGHEKLCEYFKDKHVKKFFIDIDKIKRKFARGQAKKITERKRRGSYILTLYKKIKGIF